MSKQPPAPWEATYNKRFGRWTIRYTRPGYYEKGEDRSLAQVITTLDDEKDAAVAAHIVKCVNLFDELVAAIQATIDADIDHGGNVDLELLEAVMAKAKGDDDNKFTTREV